jgi:CRP-like cAMP-binding protein
MTADTQPGASGIRAALAYRDYRWLVTGLAVSSIGVWAYNVALYVYVWNVTESPTWAAATTLGRFIPALLFSTYSGVVAERFERRRVMITGDLVCTSVMLVMAVVTGLGLTPVLVIVLASTCSIIGTIYYPATAALTPQIVEEKDLASANALQGVIENVASIAGPALGALILAVSSVEVALLVNGAGFLFSAWCTSRLRVRSQPSDVTEGGDSGIFRQIAVGFQALGASTTATILVLASCLGTLVFGADTVLLVVLADERLGLGPDGFGALLAGIGVGGVLISLVVNRLAGSPRLATIISLALIVLTLPTALLVIVDDPVIAVGLQVVRGAGMLVVDVLAITAIQRALPSDMIARVVGVFGTLSLLALSLGALLIPPLLAFAGLDGTLLVMSIGISALVLVLYPFTRRVDREMADRLAELAPRIDALSVLGVFGSADRAALERLAAAASQVTVTAGTPIVTEGEEADAFYVLLGGSVAVIATRDGAPERVRELTTGDYFGEIGILEESPRTVTIEAQDDVTVLRVPGEDFIGALTESSPSRAFLETTRARLAATQPTRELTARALAASGNPRDPS